MMERSKTKDLQEDLMDLNRALTLLCEVSTWRDSSNHLHGTRVGGVAKILGEELGMPNDMAAILYHASSLHDIGKFGIPEEILSKDTALTDEEFDIIKTHPIIGATIFSKAEGPFCAYVSSIALTHHEKMDGSGYPRGLAGYDIPLEGRITTVADIYDALRSRRAGSNLMTHADACQTIIRGDGRTRPDHFDEKVLTAFEHCADRIEEIYLDDRFSHNGGLRH